MCSCTTASHDVKQSHLFSFRKFTILTVDCLRFRFRPERTAGGSAGCIRLSGREDAGPPRAHPDRSFYGTLNSVPVPSNLRTCPGPASMVSARRVPPPPHSKPKSTATRFRRLSCHLLGTVPNITQNTAIADREQF